MPVGGTANAPSLAHYWVGAGTSATAPVSRHGAPRATGTREGCGEQIPREQIPIQGIHGSQDCGTQLQGWGTQDAACTDFFVNPPASVAEWDSREQEVLRKAGETPQEAPCGCVAQGTRWKDIPWSTPRHGRDPLTPHGMLRAKKSPAPSHIPREKHPLHTHLWGSSPPPHSPPTQINDTDKPSIIFFFSKCLFISKYKTFLKQGNVT